MVAHIYCLMMLLAYDRWYVVLRSIWYTTWYLTTLYYYFEVLIVYCCNTTGTPLLPYHRGQRHHSSRPTKQDSWQRQAPDYDLRIMPTIPESDLTINHNEQQRVFGEQKSCWKATEKSPTGIAYYRTPINAKTIGYVYFEKAWTEATTGWSLLA